MRKLEKSMIAAIRNRSEFNGRNTTVWQNDDRAEVRLHGNLIATFSYRSGKWMLTLAGWNTVTTRSRLNAICRAFLPDHGFSQQNWGAYFDDEEIDPSDHITI